MGRAIAKISDLETPSVPKTTYTIGTVRGGTSVNSIAADATFAIDMRSNDPNELSKLESRVKAAALEAVEEENERWDNGKIFVDFNLIGDRPVGKTAPESPIVQVAALTFDELDIELQELGTSSTDSNLPMSLDIPAITIAGGGRGGRRRDRCQRQHRAAPGGGGRAARRRGPPGQRGERRRAEPR